MQKNKFKIVIVLVIVLVNALGCNSELFTALIDLAKVFKAKQELSDLLLRFVSEEEKRLDQLTEFVSDLKSYNITNSHLTTVNEIEKYFSNPINTYLFTKKFAVDWKDKMDLVKDLIDNKFRKELKYDIDKHRDNLPVSDDVNGAVDALIRMQETYQLKSSDLSAGKILSYQSSTVLTADDCYDIGYHAYFAKNFPIAIKWFNEALRLYRSHVVKTDSELQEVTILDYLSYCQGSSGMYRTAMRHTDKILEDPMVENRDRFLDNKVWYLDRIALEQIPNNHDDPPFPDHPDGNIYSALCRDESPIFFKQNVNHLKCYNRVNHPIFRIRPLKVEVVFDKPRLIMFHDVLSDNEIEHFKRVAAPRLNRATVSNPQTGILEFASYRISKSAWLPDDFDAITWNVNRRIAAMTGLSTELAEDLQVVNYGIGGHYSPHFDHGKNEALDEFDKERGNRIATLLFYMSNVEAGGLTVFTDIGAKLKPRKGSAAFWFNLKPNGKGDDLTVHAACPVLVGSKWVMNKWFHERGQEFTRPCGLKNV